MSSPDAVSPALSDFLDRLARLPAAQAADEARADQDARWKAGERVAAESYLAGLPAVAAEPEQALVLIYGEVLARTARGERPTLAEYQRRCPHLAERLAVQFTVHDAIAAAPPSQAKSAGGSAGPTLGLDAAESDPGDFSADVQQTVSAFGPPGAAEEIGRLGHYRVVRLLGEGGMGLVFLAEDTRLERPVALKVMRPSIAKNPAAHERFLREAKAAAAVKHDHIVTIYQVDEHAGAPFLAMELLDGAPLDRWLQANPRPPLREVVRIGKEAAEGLAAAHARGLIHRDIKPANLWVESPTGRVKILDFGLARPARDDTQVSGSGAVVGTPAYMAPEQARGEAVDHRADLFSLGVVLYRMTTGRAPFAGTSVMAVLTSLAVDTPTPVAALNPAAPPALVGLIDQLLAKDAVARPGSAAAVADALRRVEAALEFEALPRAVPVEFPQAPDPWRDIELTEADPSYAAVPVPEDVPEPPPAPKPPRKNRRPVPWKFAVLWGALAVLVAGAAVGMFQRLRSPTPPAPDVAGDGEKPKPDPKPVPPKKTPEPPAPVFVPPLDGGFSPLDNLDPAKIPASEKFPWQPKELVAVIGTHKMRHWGAIARIVYSPKGDLVATAGPDGVRLWDAVTMAEKAFIPQGDPGLSRPESLSFSPDGHRLVMWNPVPEKLAIVLYDLGGPVPKETVRLNGYCYAQPFTPDRKHLILRNHDGPPHRYEVWDVSGGAPTKLRTLTSLTPSNFHWAVGDERLLDVTDRPTQPPLARLIDHTADGGRVLAELELDALEATVSPDGKWFVNSTKKDKKIRVYDISGGKFEEKGTFDIESHAIGLQFVPGESVLMFGDYVRWHLRNLETGMERVWVPEQACAGVAAGVAPGGKVVVTCRTATGLQAFNLNPDGKAAVRHASGPVIAVLPAPAANRAMTWEAAPHPARRWDLDGPEPKPLAIKQLEGGRAMTVLPDGRVVGLKKGTNTTLCIFDPAKGDAAEPTVIPGDYPNLWGAHTSRTGRHLAVVRVDHNRTPTLIDFTEKEPRITQLTDLPPNNGGVFYFDFSPSDQFLVAIPHPSGAPAHLWDLRGAKPKYLGALPAVDMASFALDAPILVAGCHDGKVKLYDYSTGEFKETVSMQPFARPVVGAILLPGGKTVMACDDTGHIKFLKVPTGEVEREWKWPGFAVLSLSNDGRHVYTQNANGTGYVLRLAAAPKVEPSPLDALDRSAIPAAERVPELPQDAVAVIGSHAGKHWGDVNSMACTPDGKLLATAGADGTVRLFDPVAGKELAIVQAHPAGPIGLTLSEDGRSLATRGSTGTKVWTVANGKLTPRFEIPGLANDLTFSADGKRLILAYSDADVRVIDVSGQEPRVILKSAEGHKGLLWTPVFIRGDREFATTGRDKTIHIWDATTGKLVEKLGPYDQEFGLLRIRGGQSLICVDVTGRMRTWDLSGPKPKESAVQLKLNGRVTWVAVAADGSKIACATDGALLVWNVPNPGEKPTLRLAGYHSRARFSLTADGKTLYSTQDYVGVTGAIDLTVAEPKWKPILPDAEYARPLGISPSGKLFVYQARTHGDDRNVWYDLSKNAPGPPSAMTLFPADREYVWLPRDPKSTALYTTASNNAEFVQYDLSQPPNAPPVRRVQPGGVVHCVHGTADGSTFAVGSGSAEGETIVIYRPEGDSFKEVTRIVKLPMMLLKIRLSADGRAVYTQEAQSLRKWDVSGPKAKDIKLPAGFDAIAVWDLSSDGRRLVTMTNLGFTVWDITGPDPRPVGKVDGLLFYTAWTIAISPDGRQVVVGGERDLDGQRRYWHGLYDVATGDKRREWLFPYVATFQFAPDGRHLLTANSNGTGYVIRLQRGPGPAKP